MSSSAAPKTTKATKPAKKAPRKQTKAAPSTDQPAVEARAVESEVQAAAPSDTPATGGDDEVFVPRPGSGERSFTVTEVICSGQDTSECTKGRFISKDPAGAARKAASKIFKKLFNDGESMPFEIHVRETTKGSKNSEFKYTATPFKTKDGSTTNAIPFKYEVKVRSLAAKKAAAATTAVAAPATA
ncbi:hypothetical protein GGF32_001678 [Allomyces javanicus]|nr:hypothetical protein GGF32_001678 [Allomyces javanicus]